MKITLKDGSSKEYSEAKSVYEIAKDISEGLARAACAGEVDGEIVDLRTVLDKDCTLNIITASDEEGLRVIRHTASHVLAQAVKNLFPDAKITIGPAIDDGFYYDFDSQPFSREDLDALEAEMKKIIKQGHEITRFTLPREEAIKFMKEKDEPYKVELIEELPEGEEISFYDQGGFVDLCAGPHLMSTKGVKAFKLTSSSMAYWRGDSNKARLHRIYGTAYNKKEDLKAHLERMEEAKKRDHNKLGREMELFTTVDVIGQGLPLIMPKGVKIIQKMQRWIEDLEDNEWGYVRTKTPLMAKSDLYKISDHWGHYKDGMFILGEDDEDENGNSVSGKDIFALRPMTCPFQYYVYKASQKSYRDLPYRMGETSTLFRNEDSGEMHGLTRVRQFTISEGHLICMPEQIDEEFKNCVKLAKYCLETLGLEEDVTYRMSKWDPESPDKYLGGAEEWDRVEGAMREILDEIGLEYTEEAGEAAFYGPKLDFMVKDALGRRWQLGTIQVDYNLPERFKLEYTGEDNQKHRPVMIHRAPFGSMERFCAVLIEHTAGHFPLWLTPDQVAILPISEKFNDYAQKLCAYFDEQDVRAIVDDRNEKIGRKIRDNEMKRIPYMLIVGEKEAADGTVSVRKQGEGDQGSMKFEDFAKKINEEVRNMTNKY